MQFVSSDCLQLNRFYKDNKDKARAKPSDLMFAALDEQQHTCSVLRLLPYKDFLFLRSVLTQPEQRGKGIASALIHHAIQAQAIQSNALPIYTLPSPSALNLYHRIGFKPVALGQAPAELLASYRRFRQSHYGATVMVIHP